MPLHSDTHSQSMNSPFNFINKESGQQYEIRYHYRDTTPQAKSKVSTKFQKKKPWIPPPGKATKVPPLESHKTIGSLKFPETCADLVPHDGISVAIRQSGPQEGILSNGQMNIENYDGYGISVRPTMDTFIRGMITLSDGLNCIKERLQNIARLLHMQNDLLAHSSETSGMPDKEFSQLRNQLQLVKESVVDLRSKLTCLEKNSQKETYLKDRGKEFRKESKVQREQQISRERDLSSQAECLKTKAKEIAAQILNNSLRSQDTGNLMERKQRKEDVKEAYSQEMVNIKNTDEKSSSEVSLLSQKLHHDVEVISCLLASIRRNKEFVEVARKEINVSPMHRKHKEHRKFFSKLEDVVQQLQDTMDIAAGIESNRKNGSPPVSSSSTYCRISLKPRNGTIFQKQESDFAKNMENLWDMMREKDQEIAELKRHCVQLHRISDKVREDKDIFEDVRGFVDSRVANFSNRLDEIKQKNEKLEARLREESEQTERVKELIHTFSFKLEKYQMEDETKTLPKSLATQENNEFQEHLSDDHLNDEQTKDELQMPTEDLNAQMIPESLSFEEKFEVENHFNAADSPISSKPQRDRKRKLQFEITVEDDSTDIQQRLLELQKLLKDAVPEATEDIQVLHRKDSESHENILKSLSDSDILVTGPLSQVDTWDQFRTQETSAYFSPNRAVRKESSDEELLDSLIFRGLGNLSSSVPLTSSPKPLRNEFHQDTSSEWSPLKLKTESNYNKLPSVKQQRAAVNVSLPEDDIKAVAENINFPVIDKSSREFDESETKRMQEYKKRLDGMKRVQQSTQVAGKPRSTEKEA